MKPFGQFSGHDHTISINEYQWNYDVICPNMLHKTLNITLKKLASKVMQKGWKLIIYQKLWLLHIIGSFRPLFWLWSHISYKWVSTKVWFSISKYPTYKVKNYIEESTIKIDAKRMKNYNISKNYYCFILLKPFGKFSGNDQTSLINEYQRNFDVVFQNMLYKNLNII